MRKRSNSLVGSVAEHSVSQYNVDVALFSCKGISIVRGITDSNEAESHSELPTTYQPYGFIEVGASRLIVAFTSQRKLTELTLLFQEFCYL
ncbi:hypothetical protein [Heyndrickxia coagulans]|uniref:hypothetical protein n=1 Tax=Heyndrickxia coagulans TaxID=1398 RepID=UPI001F39B774|nr:hypothetical protein [Heyndrickxia coagulans]